MRSHQSILIYCASLLLVGLLLSETGISSAQRQPSTDAQDQWQKLQAVSEMPDPKGRVAALDLFLKDHPDTPYMANVYRLQFLSYREFSQDNEQLWTLGKRYLDAFSQLIDTTSDLYEKNPLLAHLHNEVAYEFADRGVHLDGAMVYAQQSLSLIQQAAGMRSPDVPEDQWKMGIDTFRGQILDTIGWIQYKRGVYDDARKAIADALTLIPENGAVHLHLGQVLLAQGETDGAAAAYLMAGTVEDLAPEARERLEQLYRKKYTKPGEAERQLEAAFRTAGAQAQTRKKNQIVAARLDTPSPAFSVTALDGTTVSLASLGGKVVVVNFWATWCPPCRKEMPALQKVWNAYKGKDVAFLIASVDQEKEKVEPYIYENGYIFPVYYGESAAQAYGVISIPTTVVIDRQGNIQYRHIGYRPDITDVLGWQIDALLGEK